MPRLNSFYYPTDYWPSIVGDTAVLKGSEARHMLTVLRTEEEQTVRLFDGHGRDGLFRVKEVSRSRALLEALQLNYVPRPDYGVTLAIGWGKSKRRNYLFEKSVELKADGIVFWQAKRSQGRVPSDPKDTWREKLAQAAKQCLNPFFPSLSVVNGHEDLLALAERFDACFLAWESRDAAVPLLPEHLAAKKTLVVIGPEGGMEESEARALIDGGFTAVTLGDTIMRWETAATYCLSLGWLAKQETV